MRYAPGGRGHAITTWQCISHTPPSEVSGIGEAYRAEPGVHIHNSKVIRPNNQCLIPNVYNYFKAHYQYTNSEVTDFYAHLGFCTLDLSDQEN